MSGGDAPVRFDIDATGNPRWIGWTAEGSSEAFLWLDRNGNGRVDDGAELFGTATRLLNGTKAKNGFDAVAEFDDDGDGVISTSDGVWSRLLLWCDLNHDGILQPEEIVSLDQSGVTGISLQYHWTGRRDQFGNVFRYQSLVFFAGKHANTAKPLYDIFFAPVNR